MALATEAEMMPRTTTRPTATLDAGTLPPAPPYFDPAAMRRELTERRNAIEGGAAPRRAALVARLKELVGAAREAARKQLEIDGNGRRCAAGLSLLQDELIRLLFDYTVTHVYRADNPSDAERMTVIATGGYGRGLLAPGSDIDLLFLLPYKQTPWGESVIEAMLYVLWDLGLKVGHATRTVDQSIKLAHADFTIRTSLIDMRLLHGDAQLYAELRRRLAAETRRGARAFIAAKMDEREERHRRAGESRYLVEPNIKDGKGGLRDLHTLHWLAKYLYGTDLAQSEGYAAAHTAAGHGTAEDKVFSSAELATFRRCEDFLWTVRCHLHFLTGRPEERLSFDIQPTMAERLGYRDAGGMRAVERFMKHYFLIAKEVGDLTGVLCSALEMQQLMVAPRVNRLLDPRQWSRRRKVSPIGDFRVDHDRLDLADPQVFARDPVNMIRIFAVAGEMGLMIHPNALRALAGARRLIDDALRADPTANQVFLDLLSRDAAPEAALRHMNEAGVLGRFIPEFGHVVSMMQFNMYHHYTVDEHLLKTVGELTAVEDGALKDTLPLSTAIFGSIQSRRALFVAAFLHDIGKGRTQDHSVLGAHIARKLCPRFGLDAAETELVAWLIEEHLTMSTIAHTRDISDPKTIRDFAAVVQSPERLKLLLLLTVADIRAVGPGTWNGWKGQLLRHLFAETEPLVAGGHTQSNRRDRIDAAREALRAELTDWPKPECDRFVARHYDDYWLKTEPRKQADHARLIRRAEAEQRDLLTDYHSNAFNAITELTVMAPNHPRLLSLFAGACAACGANISGAHISTTRDGLALDTFMLQREASSEDDEARRVKRIAQTIDSVLKGEVRLARLMAGRKPAERRISAFSVEPQVVINNALSDHFTVIELHGLDRPGLLYDLTSTLSDLSLDITSAHITTFGERAVDVFYVTDLTGNKISSETRQQVVRQRLSSALRGPQLAAAG